ncbi:MFS transporter [Salinarimonas rosea]|uniref:MFS transporter n=1 Tax=Salinarimonas rosea TaxID=552063 RepID=UPI000413EF66|nr:MFS transporter [Salinarimonas rosea]
MSAATTQADEAAGAPLWRDRTVVALFLSMLLSMMGTHLALVALAVEYAERYGSTLAGGLVYLAQFLAPIVLTRVAGRLCSAQAPRTLLVGSELVGFASCLVLALVWDLFPAVLALLALRGFLDILTRSSRAVAVKLALPPGRVERANTIVNAPFFLGAMLGGLLGALLIERLDLGAIVLVNAATYLAAGLIYLALPRRAPPPRPAGRTSLLGTASRAFAADPELMRAFGYLVAVTALFQGVHQTARIHLPLKELGMDGSGVALLQATAFAGVFVGLLVAGRWLAGREATLRLFAPATLAAGLAGLATTAFVTPTGALSAYFVFMVLFEIAFITAMNTVVKRSEAAALPTLMVLFYAFAFGGMTLMVLASGVAFDRLGAQATFAAVLALGIGAVLAIESTARRLRARAEATVLGS